MIPHSQDLREECLKLRTRVFDLEQQNRAMSVLFQQRIWPASDLLLQVRHLQADSSVIIELADTTFITQRAGIKTTHFSSIKTFINLSFEYMIMISFNIFNK